MVPNVAASAGPSFFPPVRSISEIKTQFRSTAPFLLLSVAVNRSTSLISGVVLPAFATQSEPPAATPSSQKTKSPEVGVIPANRFLAVPLLAAFSSTVIELANAIEAHPISTSTGDNGIQWRTAGVRPLDLRSNRSPYILLTLSPDFHFRVMHASKLTPAASVATPF